MSQAVHEMVRVLCNNVVRPLACVWIALLVFGSSHGQTGLAPVATATIEHVSEGIASAQPLFRSLVPDASGRKLAYIRAVGPGRRLFVLDAETLEVERIETTNEVSQVFGWSADGRHLAFAQVSPLMLDVSRRTGQFQNETWLTVCDVGNGHIERATTNAGTVEGSFTWLSTNEFFFVSKPIGKDYAEKFIGDWKRRTQRKVFNYINDFALTSSNAAAFVQKGNIRTCRIDATNYPPIVALSGFKEDDFDSLRWLRYDQTGEKFLFCARPRGSDWRYLFQFDPEGQKVAQLNTEDTYNGQWLGGGGYAYVASRDNHFSIVVRTKDGSGDTNLFEHGSVVNYAAAPLGNRIFATASLGIEPQGIWEYNVKSGALRRVVDGWVRPPSAVRLVEPQEFRVKSEDGVQVPCFLFSPAALIAPESAARGSPSRSIGRRFPLVVYLPAPTWQFQRAFEPQSQLLANLGFYFLAVNYRGCDGYGRRYSELGAGGAAADVLWAYRKVVETARVDQKNVFLLSDSGGGSLAFDLLWREAGLWRGAVLNHSSGRFVGAVGSKPRPPPLLVISGDQDRFLPSLRQFEAWAKTNGVSMRLLVHTNCGHMNWKTAELAGLQKEVAAFFLGLLR